MKTTTTKTQYAAFGISEDGKRHNIGETAYYSTPQDAFRRIEMYRDLSKRNDDFFPPYFSYAVMQRKVVTTTYDWTD